MKKKKKKKYSDLIINQYRFFFFFSAAAFCNITLDLWQHCEWAVSLGSKNSLLWGYSNVTYPQTARMSHVSCVRTITISFNITILCSQDRYHASTGLLWSVTKCLSTGYLNFIYEIMKIIFFRAIFLFLERWGKHFLYKIHSR